MILPKRCLSLRRTLLSALLRLPSHRRALDEGSPRSPRTLPAENLCAYVPWAVTHSRIACVLHHRARRLYSLSSPCGHGESCPNASPFAIDTPVTHEHCYAGNCWPNSGCGLSSVTIATMAQFYPSCLKGAMGEFQFSVRGSGGGVAKSVKLRRASRRHRGVVRLGLRVFVLFVSFVVLVPLLVSRFRLSRFPHFPFPISLRSSHWLTEFHRRGRRGTQSVAT